MNGEDCSIICLTLKQRQLSPYITLGSFGGPLGHLLDVLVLFLKVKEPPTGRAFLDSKVDWKLGSRVEIGVVVFAAD